MRPIFALIASAVCLSACASTTREATEASIYDPFEPLNRQIYGFNEGVDKAILGPVARGYIKAVPEPARDGVTNFLANTNSPVIFANDILQAKPQRAAETLSRFIINTTIGFGGLIDVAGKSNLEGHTEDFGQTLAVWGVPNGIYVMTPFLGPSNLRDTTGRIVDMAFDPLTWIEYGLSDLDLYISSSRVLVTAVDTRARLDPAFENLRSQPEPYVALRRAYSSNRESQIRDGEIEDEAYDNLPDFDEFDDYDDVEDEYEPAPTAQ